jgi:hypothetical protein
VIYCEDLSVAWVTAVKNELSAIFEQMTRTLDAAISALAKLPTEEQERVAHWLLDELSDEDQWTRRFTTSQQALDELAAEARRDRAQGLPRV